MAPSPTTIPTSFVPKQPVRSDPRVTRTGSNTLLIIALGILGIALIASAGVFAYERYLVSVRDTKSAALEKAQQNIDASKVEEFIRTRDRFTAAKNLLNTHIAASNFFSVLEQITLQSVRFNSLSFTVTEDRSAKIQMSGTARTFNALAAQSSAFAAEKRIKRAIFSNIRTNENRTVSFTLSADLDPKLLLIDPSFVSTTAPTPVVQPTSTTSSPVATGTPKTP